jgi:hypothetical protein
MGSNNQYEHQKYWEKQEELFLEERQKFVDTMMKNPGIPLGDGIMAQIERGTIQEYNPDNFTMKSIEDWTNNIENKYKKDGESENGRW